MILTEKKRNSLLNQMFKLEGKAQLLEAQRRELLRKAEAIKTTILQSDPPKSVAKMLRK